MADQPSSAPPIAPLITRVQDRLKALENSENAAAMAAYLKTEQPFYGVKKPALTLIFNEVLRPHLPTDDAGHAALVSALWALPHREEQHLALTVAMARKARIGPQQLPLYERLIREGAWWDLVDPVAIHLVGYALKRSPELVWPVLDRWIDDEDLWIRRTALLAQARHRADTDHERLFAYCRRRMHEKEFFIRKAIGWALREYSYAAPERVRDFLLAEQDQLSGLSLREGAKQLKRSGHWD